MSKERGGTGLTNWIYFALTPITVMFFLLTGVSECRAVDFCAVSIFFMVFMGSLITLVTLFVLSQRFRTRVVDDVFSFFAIDVSISKILWIPVGLGLVLLIAFGLQGINDPAIPFISIFLSGLIISAALIRTNSAIVPILIHGLYNTIVVVLSGQFSLDTTNLPVIVPEIGYSAELIGDFGSEILFQNVLVAPSEELFRILVITFTVVAAKGRFLKNSKAVWGGVFIANSIWTVYHGLALV